MSGSKRMPAVLNSYEQMLLLKQPNPKAPTGLRNLCIIYLMLKMGLRVNEIINLKDSDIDWSRGRLHVKESGAARERILWMDQPELNILKGWLNIKPVGSSHLFCTLDGGRLKDRYIREMIKRLAAKAGIKKDVYPHLLRYTFAVDFMREVKDISLLQEALGHRDATATQAYTKLLFDDLRGGGVNGDSYKRSGMPVSSGKQQSLDFIYNYNIFPVGPDESKKAEPVVTTNSGYKFKTLETGEGGEKVMEKKNSNFVSNSCNKQYEYKGNDYSKENETIVKEINYHASKREEQSGSEAQPKATITSDKNSGERIKIPPIKCSQCGYILRYQGDCPRCGASFATILRHWGKNI